MPCMMYNITTYQNVYTVALSLMIHTFILKVKASVLLNWRGWHDSLVVSMLD